MAITIYVEDGSNVAGANSYVELADVKTDLAQRGITAPADDILQKYMVDSFAHINTLEDKFSGSRTTRGQAGAFPRTEAYSDATPLESDEIPVEIINGQYQLIADLVNGLTLSSFVSDQRIVIEEQLGPIREKRTENAGLTNAPDLTYFNALIAPLLRGNALVGGFMVVRA